jgi:hypothetical protein
LNGTVYFLDVLPAWAVFVATVAMCWLAVEGGRLAGRLRVRVGAQEKSDSVAALHGSILALLAFILAFTFGMAANRFDARKKLVLAEANAIGTCYLRAELLPSPFDTEMRALLLEYVDARLDAVQPDKLESALARAEELHALLWSQTVQVSREVPGSYGFVLFAQSLNEVIDLHEKRVVASIYDRLPGGVWGVLYAVAIIAMLATGYHLALTDSRRSLTSVALAVAFSMVIALIVDLDRPQSGALRVGQQSMVDVQESMIGPSEVQ